MDNEKAKSMILAAVDDLVTDFLYYSRKEDEDMPRGFIEDAIKYNVITASEITAEFEKKFNSGIK